MQHAASYVLPAISFVTKSEGLAKTVEAICTANREDRNIFIFGLRDYYETQPFQDNLRDLKRFLFSLSAKHRLKS